MASSRRWNRSIAPAAAKRIIGATKPLTPEEAADPAFDLRGLAKRKESAVRRGLWLLNKVTPPAISFESYDSMKTSSPSIRVARRRGKPIHAAYSGTIALPTHGRVPPKATPFPRLSRR